MTSFRPDFGATAADYRTHRAGFPDSLFERLQALGIGIAGQRVLDLGTGTGTLARGFARRGCAVIALDPSAPLLAEAVALDTEAGVRIAYLRARAEATGLRDAAADVVSAGQCWHWFDRARAAAEVARVLRPAGRIAIAHFDWIPLPGNVVQATEELIAARNPAWRFGGGRGIHSRWLTDLGAAGFRAIETFSYDVAVPYSPEAWRGRIRASAGVGATLTPDAVEGFDREHAALLAARFPGATLDVPHRVFAVVADAPRG